MIDPGVRGRFIAELADYGLTVTEVDNERPWGGEFIFGESQLEAFIKTFFPDRPVPRERLTKAKLLLIEPHHRLSWQYHERRSEMWHVMVGPIELASGPDDEQPPVRRLDTGAGVEIGSGVRHRLEAMDSWGAVAELWMNDDPANPSTEDDLVRIEDDYDRS